MLNTDHFDIQQLVEVCVAKGMSHAVICPGSRNAPLTIAFNRSEIECIVIPDERVAGFFAMGIAQQTGMPTALICTSGSAVLNFAPAIVEAYYQGLPLLVLTADRPAEIIDQGHGQTIRQSQIYTNYVKGSMDFQEGLSLEEVESQIGEAFDFTLVDKPGPVHVNIPIREPLYGLTEEAVDSIEYELEIEREIFELAPYLDRVNDYNKVMLIVGQLNDEIVNEAIKACIDNKNIVVLTEATSNIEGLTIQSIDRFLSSLTAQEEASFAPDLLISIGGAVVSKKIKAFINKYKPKEHWNVGPIIGVADTYDALTEYLEASEERFVDMLSAVEISSDYHQLWHQRDESLKAKMTDYLAEIDWSDFKVFETLFNFIPVETDIHFGNSTVVRYANLFDLNANYNSFCNRGTSGIDGVTSTAMGSAYVFGKTTTVITGDIAFLYDSNALWHKYMDTLDLKIILINNGGGGIFRIIPGPDQLEELEAYFDCYQEVDIKKLVEAYGLTYQVATDVGSLTTALSNLYTNTGVQFLEIKTDGKISAEVLRNYFQIIGQ